MNYSALRQKLRSVRSRSGAFFAAQPLVGEAEPLDGGEGAPQPAPPVADHSILDEYVLDAPSPQNALDLFQGEWSSAFPPPLDDLRAGKIGLFGDDRIEWALKIIGDVSGQRALELGPLEGGHSYMLTNAGAEVLAIEAQTRAFLKCLIAKELLGMPAATFMLGDFLEYLRGTEEQFDICLASGVLYHMRNPVELIALMRKVSRWLVLWTHYYDHEVVTGSDLLRPRFPSERLASFEGFEHRLHEFRYESALQLKGFCGGTAPHSQWLSRDDLLAALGHFGWEVDEIGFDSPDHPHGPALALVAHQKTA